MDSRKIVLMKLFAGQQWKHRHREQTYSHRGGGRKKRVGCMEKVTCRFIFSSVQFSRSVMSNSLRPHELQHARPPCPSPTTGVYSNPCPLSRWCHPTISSSVLCPQSFQHQGLFQWVSSSHQVAKVLEFQLPTAVFPVNTQDWSPLGWTGWISLQSKGLSRVFSNTVQKHQFFCTQLSL